MDTILKFRKKHSMVQWNDCIDFNNYLLIYM